MKKNFAEPEMEVVRFNAQEIVTATSGEGGGGNEPMKEVDYGDGGFS